MAKGSPRVTSWLLPQSYATMILFLLLCNVSVTFVWLTFVLVMLSMANISFLRRHGVMAIAEGWLVQLLLISGKGMVAMIAYITFRVVEAELLRRWVGRGRED